MIALIAAVALGAIGSQLWMGWTGLAWIPITLATGAIVVIASCALIIQFRWRRRALARLAVLGGVLVALIALNLLPWTTAFAVQARIPARWDAKLTAVMVPATELPPGFVRAQGPMWLGYEISGVEPTTPVGCEGAKFTLEGPAGHTWSSRLATDSTRLGYNRDGLTLSAARMSNARDGCWYSIRPPDTFKDIVGIPDVGRCTATSPPQPPSVPEVAHFTRVVCENAFLAPAGVISLGPFNAPVGARANSFSPFPATFSIAPIRALEQTMRRVDVVTINQWAPIAHVTIDAEPATINDIGWLGPAMPSAIRPAQR